ncbi:MAG: TRAP transporter large permease [Dehalococcoidia bacterium]|nr:MAG: TRAP transporter large permease [Dehalococcoidia bacterium]
MWLMFLLLFGLLALGVPIGVALASSAVAYWLVFTGMNPAIVPAVFFEFINSYPLMAAPFFILAGMLMERSKLLEQIFLFADSLLGWLKGGMGAAGLVTAVIFAALTGSAVAAASALTLIVIPRMVAVGHPKNYAAGLVCSGGTLAQLIPPSVWLIIYGVLTETSVASLFFAGFVPGLLLAGLLIILNLIISSKQDLKLTPFDIKLVWYRFKHSLPGLGLPVLVLGGLYGGVFTPTEAGAAACAYAIIYGYIVTKGRFTATLIAATKPAMKTTAMLFFLLGCVGIFQSLAANQYWPQELSQWALGLGLNKYTFLFGYIIVGLILGCFLDGLAIIALTVPVVFPIGMTMGVDPLHLGILLVLVC